MNPLKFGWLFFQHKSEDLCVGSCSPPHRPGSSGGGHILPLPCSALSHSPPTPKELNAAECFTYLALSWILQVLWPSAGNKPLPLAVGGLRHFCNTTACGKPLVLVLAGIELGP